MAFVKFDLSHADFLIMQKLQTQFPELRARLLGYVGARGVTLLRNDLLRGQELNLRAYPVDRARKATIRYSVGRKASYVTIASYPLNLFERGRGLRSGRREPGRHIMRGSFRRLMESRMAGILMEFDKKVVQEHLNKI